MLRPMHLPHLEYYCQRDGVMGRESNDSAVIHSSITLLQERFRQLQRIKEIREEKELLRLITLAKAEQPRPVTTTTTPRDKPTWFFHPELLHPSRPLRNSNTYLRLDSHGGTYANTCFSEDKSPSIGLYEANMHAPKHPNEAADVDTSLHL